jgi:hypothetical protein
VIRAWPVLTPILLTACSGSGSNPPAPPVVVVAAADPPPVSNVVFAAAPTDPTAVPPVKRLDLPAVPGGSAVWGATGRDHVGRVYFGVACSGPAPSAHLLEYDPKTTTVADRGSAVDQLWRLRKAEAGVGQAKIHSKILQGPDGFLYFASMDEAGEKDDGSKLPTHGSHLWRTKPGSAAWEHLAAVPEGVIACAVGGRFVYYLGYFGHFLYRFDPATKGLEKKIVGSAGGHISRNFFADARGHVYVPRVTKTGARLVEFDEYLTEVAATKLADYSLSPDADSHGIVGVAPLKDGIAFTTDKGRLYRVTPQPGGSRVDDLGYVNPTGPSYPAALYSPDGGRWVCGIGSRPGRPEPTYEWLAFDLKTKSASAKPIAIPVPAGAQDVLVYGSFTRDDAGAFYAVGRYTLPGPPKRHVPAVWRVGP